MKVAQVLPFALSLLTLTGCNDYLDYKPTAVVDEDQAFKNPDQMVTSAYALMGDDWYTYPFNLWPYGDLASDDALKGGSGTTDTDYHQVEVFTSLVPTLGHLDELWYHLYIGVSRCNRAIVALQDNGEAKLGAELTKQRMAEVKFLRAHFYFKLKMMFNKIPWIDEEVYRNDSQEQIKNDVLSSEEIWDKIITDFKEAYDVLPSEQSQGGRTNKIAAAAYLAKCYLEKGWGDGYEKSSGDNYVNEEDMKKVVEYTDVVKNSRYGYLEDYGDIFLPEYKNSKESIFAVQHSDYEDDNTAYGRANWSNMLNGTWGIWSCGWDFHKPSQNFVNAFKTRDGLPQFDDYAKENAHPVNGVPTSQKWDPRLFHTVGMPTFPYKYEEAYTLTTANSRTPNTYGYYTSLKEVPQRSKGETYNSPWQAFAMNDYVIRYTQSMLDRAEALIELGQFAEAREIINDIRNRAKNSVAKHISYAANQCEIALYPESYFQTKESARKCLRWERRLEMGMEHERFFDLRRWGLLSSTLNNYFKLEQNDEYDGQKYAQYLKDAHFTTDKNEYFPIPYPQLYYIPGLYSQNKGY
ncbi:RagB/SusD family nutrient uptake outer membrane protein [Segatella bryantii]|uniref:RagB/SusD family nutrient uptake outer membrane protein n=1 Tax=Segatella bryantii TaxID=77095 RepID=UPI001EDA9B8F|nr:RagB/SusD family nutrient uptake outer membrane protein [Segatella bryantii]UKK75320.1 RagB/SusD family nutrient uptake outer membrane protein [Segatella bryantii]